LFACLLGCLLNFVYLFTCSFVLYLLLYFTIFKIHCLFHYLLIYLVYFETAETRQTFCFDVHTCLYRQTHDTIFKLSLLCSFNAPCVGPKDDESQAQSCICQLIEIKMPSADISLRPRFGAAPGRVILSRRPICTAVKWSIVHKHEMIHKTGSTRTSHIATPPEQD